MAVSSPGLVSATVHTDHEGSAVAEEIVVFQEAYRTL